jgi:hypothetical protein
LTRTGALGSLLVIVAVCIVFAAVIAGRDVRQSAALLVLMILQIAFTAVGSSAPAIAALHVVGGLAIAIVAYRLRRAAHAPDRASRRSNLSVGAEPK